MEINPYETRLRMLQLQDGVQMQREALPDDETAGCPGCPFYWTCDVPHRGETVHAEDERRIESLHEDLPSRSTFRPHDESDIGWTDEWIEVDEPAVMTDPEHPDPVIPPHDEPGAPRRRRSRTDRGSRRWGGLRRRRRGDDVPPSSGEGGA